MARFAREAQVLALLNHPNIAGIYGVEDRALVMELVEGAELRGPLTEEQALPIIHQLIDALEYAHEKGIVHRDLKPANIKLGPDNRVKVLDFGLAKALTGDPVRTADSANSPTLTMRATLAGVILGTAAYMSPEQARGQSVDKRADIWAFGAILYEILTGEVLFDAPTVSDTLAAVLTRDPMLDRVPLRFRRLVRLCVARDPRQRLRDISGARLLLDEPATPSPVRAPGRSAVLPWLVAGVCAAAACGFAWLWQHAGPPSVPASRFAIEATPQVVVSPNGKWLLDAWSPLKLRALDRIAWTSLAGTEGASDPFWSSDSSAIGFFSGGQLRVMAVGGAAPRAIAPAPGALGGDWRGSIADGTILFATSAGLQTLDLKSGAVRALPIRSTASQTVMDPVFLPEGDGFLFEKESGGKKRLFRSALSSPTEGEPLLDTQWLVRIARHPRTGQWHMFYIEGVEHTLLARPIDARSGAAAGAPVHVADFISTLAIGRGAGFSVSDNGLIVLRYTTTALPIWRPHWFNRNGNIVGTLGDRDAYTALALAPDGLRVAAVRGFPNAHVWVFNQNGVASRVSSFAGREQDPVWSPDGRTLYYIASSNDKQEVIRRPLDGGATESIYQQPGVNTLRLHDITPDGQRLLAAFTDSGATSIVELDLSTPVAARKLKVVLPAPEGSRIGWVRIAPDGKSLFFYAGLNTSDGAALYVTKYPVQGAPRRLDLSVPLGSTSAVLSRDGHSLYQVSASPGAESIVVQAIRSNGSEIEAGPRTPLFRVITPTRAAANTAAVSLDGARVLVIATDLEEEFRTQILTDWTTLIKP
jgi:serine/threonine-protein kinase